MFKHLATIALLAVSPLIAQAAEDSQLILSCTEKQTFLDAPGYEYLVSIGGGKMQAFINERPISMEGLGEWSVLAPLFTVNSSDEGFVLNEYQAPVNWEQEGSCFVFQKSVTISLHKDASGKYDGQVTRDGYILENPSVKDCSAPHIARAQPTKVACKLY